MYFLPLFSFSPFQLRYFLSSTTSHPPGVLRPTDCLATSGRLERGLNCPASSSCLLHYYPGSVSWYLGLPPRPWQVKEEKSSSQEFLAKDKPCFDHQCWKLRFSIWIWIDRGVRCGLSLDWSQVGALKLGSRQCRSLFWQGKAKLEVTPWAKAKPASNHFGTKIKSHTEKPEWFAFKNCKPRTNMNFSSDIHLSEKWAF